MKYHQTFGEKACHPERSFVILSAVAEALSEANGFGYCAQNDTQDTMSVRSRAVLSPNV